MAAFLTGDFLAEARWVDIFMVDVFLVATFLVKVAAFLADVPALAGRPRFFGATVEATAIDVFAGRPRFPGTAATTRVSVVSFGGRPRLFGASFLTPAAAFDGRPRFFGAPFAASSLRGRPGRAGALTG